MVTALIRLSTREARKKLPRRVGSKSRIEPYFIEHRHGVAIGYRPGTEPNTAGRWLLREFRGGRYVKRMLGTADDLVPADGVSVLSWEDVQRIAGGEERPTVTRPGKLSLAEAAEAYFDTRRATTPHDRYTWKEHISKASLASKPVSEITTGDLEKWLAAQVPQIEDREKRRAAQATANRRWSVLRAILNSAFRKDPARVPSDGAWRRVRPFAKTDRPRTRTLTTEECKRLLSKLEGPLHAMAQGALYTGLRLGEIEALQVGDVGPDFVRVRNSKSGKPRTVPLNEEGAELFGRLVSGKAREDLVFDRMYRVAVSREMKAACEAAAIVPPAVFHDLRRTYGSLLLNEHVASDAIQELLGHADLRMTRRAYAHLSEATLVKAVRKLPSFAALGPKKRARGKVPPLTRS
jgi:integrase